MVLLIVDWFFKPTLDVVIWEVLLIAPSFAVTKLMRMSSEAKRMQMQALSHREEIRFLNSQIIALTAEARHDKLTGLGNRNLLEDRFGQAKERAIRNRSAFALLMIDLNEFKSINDHFGHAAGDEVLIAVGRRLSAAVRGTDSVIRLGGDEFVILVEEADNSEGLRNLSQKLMGIFCEDVELTNHLRIHIGASIGMVQFPTDGHEIVGLLDLADQAMYECKASTRMPLDLR